MAATEAADAGEKPTTSGLPRFSIPSVAFNAGGWGPMSLPERFASVPYAYFTKGDRLGKVADFTSRARARREEDDDDEDRPRDDVSWTTVDQAQTRKKWDPRKRWQRGRPRPLTAAAQRGYDDKEKLGDLVMGKQRAAAASTHNKRNKKLREARWAGRPRYDDRNKVTRKLSVNVETDWVTIESAELSALAKLKSSAPPVEDLKWCGNLCTYDDRSFDRITTRTAPALRRFEDREFFYVSSRWDPVIEDLAKSGAGNVFATDALLAQIMASPRSVFPWDIVITCLRGKIFFDVRDAAEFEFLTVNETAHEPPNEEDSEGINSQAKLSIEASMINQNFGQQVLREAGGDGEGETKAPDGKPLETNPFWDADDSEFSEPAKLAYRYRRWDLGDDIKLVARTTVHSVVRKADKQSLATVFALNEWDSRSFGAQPWRKIIDSQVSVLISSAPAVVCDDVHALQQASRQWAHKAQMSCGEDLGGQRTPVAVFRAVACQVAGIPDIRIDARHGLGTDCTNLSDAVVTLHPLLLVFIC